MHQAGQNIASSLVLCMFTRMMETNRVIDLFQILPSSGQQMIMASHRSNSHFPCFKIYSIFSQESTFFYLLTISIIRKFLICMFGKIKDLLFSALHAYCRKKPRPSQRNQENPICINLRKFHHR